MSKILLVEDDRELGNMITACLQYDHYTVESVQDGKEAIARLKVYDYALVLLDWGLPGMSGIEICKKFRAVGGTTPILMLTARADVAGKEEGLDSGADDYLAKPFDMKELSARIRALLRRASGSLASNKLTFQDIVLEPQNFRVTRNGRDIVLLNKEFALLELFMRHPKQVFSVDSLINHVWKAEEDCSAETVRQQIKNLRKKIELDGAEPIIHNIRGVGYKLDQC